ARLAGLERILAALREGSAREQEQLLRRAHALLPTLREAAAAPPPWGEYRPSPAPVGTALAALAQPAQAVRGIGPQRAAELARFGLATVEDLLYHLPFRYEDRRALQPLGQLHVGEEATAVGEVARVREARAGRRGRHVLEVVLRDGDGLLLLVWFHQIPYFSRRLREGQRLVVHGRVEPPLGGGPRPTSRRSARCARSPTARSSSTSSSSSSSGWHSDGAPPGRSRARPFRRPRASCPRCRGASRSGRRARRSAPLPRSRPTWRRRI